MEEWANSLILVISPDLKHTNTWDCEVCGMGDNLLLLSPQILNFVPTGKLSRETSVDSSSPTKNRCGMRTGSSNIEEALIQISSYIEGGMLEHER